MTVTVGTSGLQYTWIEWEHKPRYHGVQVLGGPTLWYVILVVLGGARTPCIDSDPVYNEHTDHRLYVTLGQLRYSVDA